MLEQAATSAPPGPAQVACPFCKEVLAVSVPLAGQLARCLTCRNQFRLPGVAKPPSAPATASPPVAAAEPTARPSSLAAYAVTNSLAAYAVPSGPLPSGSLPSGNAPSVVPAPYVPAPHVAMQNAALPPLGFISDGRVQAPVGASLRESVARPGTPAAAFPTFPAFEPVERPDPAALAVLPPPVSREAVPAQLLGLPEPPVAEEVPVLGPQIEMPVAVPPLTEKRREKEEKRI